ncbi:MAG TPA: YciI family protein [Myxococcaceae bacterium]|nr:YciI family protein [Myxococcaceae bacterium]
MQFLIIANDFRDPEALSRRMQQRPAHIEGVKRMKAEGTFLDGGAMLDDEGRMVGSMVLVEFPSRPDVDAWLAADPYVTGKVWEHVTVRAFRRVQFPGA